MIIFFSCFSFPLIAIVYPLGCRAIGVDVSPPCIAMARNLAQEENICETKCAFFEADATVSPDILLSGKPVSNIPLVNFRERRFNFPRLCMCCAAWLLTAHRNLKHILWRRSITTVCSIEVGNRHISIHLSRSADQASSFLIKGHRWY